MKKLSCSAILFDLGGVLIESRPAVERQWAIWAREHHLDPGEVIHVAHGRHTIDTIRQLAPQLDAAAEAGTIEQHVIAVPTTYAVEELGHANVLIQRLSDLRVTVANTHGRQAIHLELLLPDQ